MPQICNRIIFTFHAKLNVSPNRTGDEQNEKKRNEPTKRDENAKQLRYRVWVIAYTTRQKEKQNKNER